MTDFAAQANEHFTKLVSSLDGFLAQQGIALENGVMQLEEENKVVILLELELPLILGIDIATKLRNRIKDILIKNYDRQTYTIEEVELEAIEICNGDYQDITTLDDPDAIITTEIRLIVTPKNI